VSIAVALLAGCSGPQAPPSDGAPPPTSTAVPAASTGVVASAATAPTAAPEPSAAPAASASPASSATAAPAASATAAPPPLPDVKVENIGIHIGGEKNLPEQKAPIRASVDPHMDDFRRCFALAEDPKKGGTFGVDLMIPKDGGKAEVTKPRTSLEGKPFRDCVTGVFAAIEFTKLKTGKTKVSYSLRFSP
jgi:hypothetical protein